MISALDHVQIAAPRGCEAEARRFYGEGLGLEEIPKPAELAGRGGVWFRVGAQELHIGVEEPFRPARKAHPAFRADDLDALAGRLGDVTWDDSLPDVRRFFVSDPFGNRVEVLQSSNSSGRP